MDFISALLVTKGHLWQNLYFEKKCSLFSLRVILLVFGVHDKLVSFPLGFSTLFSNPLQQSYKEDWNRVSYLILCKRQALTKSVNLKSIVRARLPLFSILLCLHELIVKRYLQIMSSNALFWQLRGELYMPSSVDKAVSNRQSEAPTICLLLTLDPRGSFSLHCLLPVGFVIYIKHQSVFIHQCGSY